MLEHFSRVADAAAIPIVVQDAPLSGVTLTVPFLVRLAREVPLIRYFKIEVPETAAKLRTLIEAGGDAIAGPFDGEEAITLVADPQAGATGTMPSALSADLIKPIVAHFRAGHITAPSQLSISIFRPIKPRRSTVTCSWCKTYHQRLVRCLA